MPVRMHLRLLETALVSLRATLDLTIALVRSYDRPSPPDQPAKPPTFNQPKGVDDGTD